MPIGKNTVLTAVLLLWCFFKTSVEHVRWASLKGGHFRVYRCALVKPRGKLRQGLKYLFLKNAFLLWSLLMILYRDFIYPLLQWQKNTLQQKAVSSTRAQSSLSQSQPCRISQVVCLAYAVLHAGCYLPPLLLRSPEAWIRACTMSSCSSSTNKSSRRWTLDCPCCAEPVQRLGSPGS